MGKIKPVTLGHLSFAKQGDAKSHFKEILNRHKKGTILSGNDFADVEALLSGHPRAQEKIGVGLRALTIASDEMGGQCFHIVRTDETVDNFSYNKCIAGDPAPFTAFSLACRRAVEDDLYEFKVSYFTTNQDKDEKVRCPETKKRIAFGEAHVDHRSPLSFSVIVKFFIDSRTLDLAKVKLKREGLYGNELGDAALAENFRLWHKKTAMLRVIEAGRNLAKSPLARIKPTKADHTLPS
jgi:hypothetical protein